MAAVTALDRYRAYLEAIDDEARNVTSEDAYLDLLAPSEAIDLLCVRDELVETDLAAVEQRERDQLDDLLVKHRRLIAENISPTPGEPRERWWWHLHEGPQVRAEALAAARDR